MAITLLLYPWNEEKQEWSDVGRAFTFGQMNPDYYNRIANGGSVVTDYGYYLDNVIGRGTNILDLAYPDTPLTELTDMGPNLFPTTNTGESVTSRTFFKYKISDTLTMRVQLLIYTVFNKSSGKCTVYGGVSLGFKSTLNAEEFWISGDLFSLNNSTPMTYTEFVNYCEGVNPISKIIKSGLYQGLNAYPDNRNSVETAKTTTGLLIQSFTLYMSGEGAVVQYQTSMWGGSGDVVIPFNNTAFYKFYVGEILGFGYELVFPPSLEDDIVGGYGNDSDEGSVQPLPEQSAVRSGMVRLYQMSTTQLNNFAKFLWNTDFGDWSSFMNTLKQWFSNPLDSIISLSISPIDFFYNYESSADNKPEPTNIKLGGFDTGVQGYQCVNNYIQISLGKINLKPYYATFLDTNPHTKFSLYLPYISFVDIDGDVLFSKGGTAIEVVYNIDILTGVCVANILIEKESNGTHLKHVIYTFSGNVNTTIPISSANMKDFISASIGAVASAVAIGGTGGTATPLVLGSMAAQEGMKIASQKMNVSHSGGTALESGMFAMQYAYFIVTRPREARPSNYKNINGIPSEIGGTLSQFSGFTKVSSVHVNINGATEEEKQQIEQLLKDGVII